jgi:hypothetical protein
VDQQIRDSITSVSKKRRKNKGIIKDSRAFFVAKIELYHELIKELELAIIHNKNQIKGGEKK